MSEERDKALGELRQRAGDANPLLAQAENYGKGMRAAQGVIAEQGQVMSAALQNNEVLYHTNKQLKHDLRVAETSAGNERARANRLQKQLEKRDEYIAKLEAGGGDKFRPLYEQARQTLANYLHDALTQEELRAKLGEMKEQAKAIEADPQALTPEQILEAKRSIGFDEQPVEG